MTTGNRIAVKREIYKWAIKESHKEIEEIEEIKEKFPNIEKWMEQESQPTFKQLENLSNYLKIPFGYMFLDKPPASDIIEGEFRTIGNKIPNISKNLKDTIYDMGRKQDWISQYREENGWDKIIKDNEKIFPSNDPIDFAKKAKEQLKLDEFWYKNYSDHRLAYNFLRREIESKGIIVMQNGIVGANTQRKLDVNEFRGFMLYDEYAPLIFINTNDSSAGKIFTLIHEYIHVLFGKEDVFINKDLDNEDRLESDINEITAEFLMPRLHIENQWNVTQNNLEGIDNLSVLFKVSKLALSIRLKELGLIKWSLVNKIKEITKNEVEVAKKESSGGDYWNNNRSRYSNSFVETVVQGAESGDISYSYAFNLLNVRAKGYDVLKRDVIGYAFDIDYIDLLQFMREIGLILN